MISSWMKKKKIPVAVEWEFTVLEFYAMLRNVG